MKKSLIALAALAATGASFAQSSVTISGFFNGSYDAMSISGRTSASNKSENRVSDNASRILFNVVEDLGGGMSALGQFDLRIPLDQQPRLNALCGTTTATTCAVPNPVPSGNQHVGLSSTAWGAVRLGRQDIHFTENGNFNPVSLPTLHNAAGVLVTAAAGQAVGRTTRSANLIWWTSPVMNGLGATVGYSTNSYATSGYQDGENDLASSQRKGATTYFRLGYTAGKLNLALSNINEKSDWIGSAATASGVSGLAASQTAQGAVADRKGTIVSAKYDFGVVKAGVAYAQNESTAMAAGAAGATTKRKNTQFGLGLPVNPVSDLALTYTKIGDAGTANAGGTHTTLAYSYNLSKRTQLVAAYTSLKNETAGAHSLFYNADNVIGSIGSTAAAGEKHTVTSVGVRHSF